MAASALAGAQAPAPAANANQFGNAQTLCTPAVIGNRRIPKESCLRACSRARATCTTPPSSSATSTRSGTPATSRVSASSASTSRQRNTPPASSSIVYVREKPTIREINYKGLNAVSRLGRAGALQEGQGRPHGRKPVRPHPHQARGSRPARDLLGEHGHQFATIKTEVKTIPPAAVALTFNIKEGPTVKVGKIVFDGNQNLSDRDPARGDEEPEAHRHSALDHPREPLPAHLRRQQAGRRRRARAPGLPRPGLLQGASPASRRPTCATPAASTPSRCTPPPASASTS